MDSPEPRRSIQDIIPPPRSRSVRPSVVATSSYDEKQPTTPLPPRPTPPEPMDLEPEPHRSFMKFGIIFGGAILVAGVGIVLASTLFHRAYVTVTPQKFDVVINDTFTTAPDSATLPYQKVTAEDTLTSTVPATGSKQVSDRASGTLIVYNAYSTQSQRLITNTRFLSPDGLLYRIHTPVTIPGYTTKAGLKVPGSVEITVYADEAGEKYNIGLTDFTLPGLKDTDRYALVYARSKTPLTGGFVGEKAIVDTAVRNQVIQKLKTDLDSSLRAKITTAIPVGTIVFPATVQVTYTEGADKIDGTDAVISVSGSAVAPALNHALFASVLGHSGNVTYQNEIKIENPADLTVTLGSIGSVIAGNQLTLNVSGNSKLVAVFDTAKLAQDLAGKSKSDVAAVQASYPGMAVMDVKAYPFWLRSLPADSAKITVEIADQLTSE